MPDCSTDFPKLYCENVNPSTEQSRHPIMVASSHSISPLFGYMVKIEISTASVWLCGLCFSLHFSTKL